MDTSSEIFGESFIESWLHLTDCEAKRYDFRDTSEVEQDVLISFRVLSMVLVLPPSVSELPMTACSFFWCWMLVISTLSLHRLYWTFLPPTNTSLCVATFPIGAVGVIVSVLEKEETISGLAGVADLYVSAAGGRNSKMGSYLGKGFTFQTAKRRFMPKDTVEGEQLAKEIAPFVLKKINKKKIPLMIKLLRAILNNKKLKIS